MGKLGYLVGVKGSMMIIRRQAGVVDRGEDCRGGRSSEGMAAKFKG
jgi:hypothetical protein